MTSEILTGSSVDYSRQPRAPLGESPVSLLGSYERRDDNLIEAKVPTNLIFGEDVPVDNAHVEELAQSIARESSHEGRTGQLLPVLLGEVPGYSMFVIIDGFHRTSALKQLGRDEVFASIRRNCTRDEVIDLRILAARTHKSVKFSRLIEWIEDAWSLTPWADRMTATQAFAFRQVQSFAGKRRGLTPAETVGVKRWVEDKSAQWHLGIGTIASHLSVAATADPELVKRARERKGGHTLEEITPNHLKAIAQSLPHRYDIQRLVADVAVENRLTTPQTKAVAVRLSSCSNLSEAIAVIQTIDQSNIEPLYSERHERRRRQETPFGRLSLDAPQFILQGLTEGVQSYQSLLEKGQITEISQYDRERLRTVGKTCIELASRMSEPSTRLTSSIVEFPQKGRTPSPSTARTSTVPTPKRIHRPDHVLVLKSDGQGVETNPLAQIEEFEASVKDYLLNGGIEPEFTTDGEIRAVLRAMQNLTSGRSRQERGLKGDGLERFHQLNDKIRLRRTPSARSGWVSI